MKFVLTLLMCTSVGNQCLPPYQNPTIYDDAYDCMIAGYKKSSEKIIELGREDVNEYNIYIKFGCTPVPAKATAI